ncbi:ParB/RepB/Spo0J family partition protein [Phytoactinopolyspora limicola]|uniref:ParB/RepB/Spo0J family partition protein n=1 Tax=Phytoactinopolyspora limicola TaxID=2715536 RepID=UPI00140D2CC6|nr:ParB N-terminal domain-containing protein [Phytoactinopolyspora limicola]
MQYSVAAIRLGRTYRHELGDLSELCQSIRAVGLLHPVVISPDGLLISGRRRLEAVKRLNWRRVPVWVATHISDRLRTVMAVQHENTIRKDLTPVEAAELYAELKALYADEAARRQASTRFGSGEHGAVDSTAPQDARVQAARAITGRDSHGMLEQVLELRRIVDSEAPEWLRAETEQALAELNADGKVHGRYLAITTAKARFELEDTATDPAVPERVRDAAESELEHLAAIDHPAIAAREAKRATKKVHSVATGWSDIDSSARDILSARRVATFAKQHFGWWENVSPQAVAEHLDDEQWNIITACHDGCSAFMRAAIDARNRRDGGVRTAS